MSANAVEAAPLTTAADFQALEKKVLRTIELVKTAREAQANAERDVTRLRSSSPSVKRKSKPCARK